MIFRSYESTTQCYKIDKIDNFNAVIQFKGSASPWLTTNQVTVQIFSTEFEHCYKFQTIIGVSFSLLDEEE